MIAACLMGVIAKSSIDEDSSLAQKLIIGGPALALFILWGLLFLVAIMVLLFNRPKFVVPPHLRDQPGALREWRRLPNRATDD